MDVSEIYIKMCEKAQEVQDLSFKVFGDKKSYIVHDTWLPRQDQLQEMSREDIYQTTYAFIKFLSKFMISESEYYRFHQQLDEICECGEYEEEDSPELPRHSFEQLWLSFIMEQQFGKIWNQEKEEWEIKK